MAVMRSFCGCLTTRAGTITILMLYSLFYIAGIVLFSIDLAQEQMNAVVIAQMSEGNNCTMGPNAATWWCQAVNDLFHGIEYSLIVGICVFAIFLITAILAIYGTSKGKPGFILIWIILDFIFLVLIAIVLVLVVVILAMYTGQEAVQTEEDLSLTVAVAIIYAAIIAFFFYLWLCVVSHYQILKEVHKLGLANLENVQPFKNDDEDYTDTEDVYNGGGGAAYGNATVLPMSHENALDEEGQYDHPSSGNGKEAKLVSLEHEEEKEHLNPNGHVHDLESGASGEEQTAEAEAKAEEKKEEEHMEAKKEEV